MVPVPFTPAPNGTFHLAAPRAMGPSHIRSNGSGNGNVQPIQAPPVDDLRKPVVIRPKILESIFG